MKNIFTENVIIGSFLYIVSYESIFAAGSEDDFFSIAECHHTNLAVVGNKSFSNSTFFLPQAEASDSNMGGSSSSPPVPSQTSISLASKFFGIITSGVSNSTGTGVLLGSRFFLTAAHNVMHPKFPLDATTNQIPIGSKPPTPAPVSTIEIFFPSEGRRLFAKDIYGFYVSNAYPQNTAYDFALVVFKEDIPYFVQGTPFDGVTLNNEDNTSVATDSRTQIYTYIDVPKLIKKDGESAPKIQHHQVYSLERVDLKYAKFENRLLHTDSSNHPFKGGDSGSIILFEKNNIKYPLGIHVMGLTGNPQRSIGVFLTKDKLELLQQWIGFSERLEPRKGSPTKINTDIEGKKVNIQCISLGRDFIAVTQNKVVALYHAQNPSQRLMSLSHGDSITAVDFHPKDGGGGSSWR